MDIDIQSVGFTADQKLVNFINEKVEKLSHFFDRIVACEVYLRVEKKSVHENKLVEIKMNIPGKDLFAKKHCDSFEEATAEAVEALRKQIKKHKGKVLAV
ncbi:MAG: ribosome-associated translation inhibitor RaiA [Brumimicrobium sp.]